MTLGLVSSSAPAGPFVPSLCNLIVIVPAHARLVDAALTDFANRYHPYPPRERERNRNHPLLTRLIWASGLDLDQAEMPLAGGGLGPAERFCFCGTWPVRPGEPRALCFAAAMADEPPVPERASPSSEHRGKTIIVPEHFRPSAVVQRVKAATEQAKNSSA
jgi:hypothetical protein